MNHCILAMKENNDYLSVLCIYEGQISSLLEQHYNSEAKARSLVELGDINNIQEHEVNAFHRDWGISWRYTKPQHYADKSSLIQYCEASGLDRLFLFDEDEWQTVEFEESFDLEDMEDAEGTMNITLNSEFDIDRNFEFDPQVAGQFDPEFDCEFGASFDLDEDDEPSEFDTMFEMETQNHYRLTGTH